MVDIHNFPDPLLLSNLHVNSFRSKLLMGFNANFKNWVPFSRRDNRVLDFNLDNRIYMAHHFYSPSSVFWKSVLPTIEDLRLLPRLASLTVLCCPMSRLMRAIDRSYWAEKKRWRCAVYTCLAAWYSVISCYLTIWQNSFSLKPKNTSKLCRRSMLNLPHGSHQRIRPCYSPMPWKTRVSPCLFFPMGQQKL